MVIHTLDFADRSPLEIGFLTQHNPFDKRSFSGTAFFASKALAARTDVNLRILGSHRRPQAWDRLFKRKPADITVTPPDVAGLDLVIGLVATDLLEKVHKAFPSLPTLHITDATPAFLRDAYGWRLPADADARESRVAAGTARVIYSSDTIAARAPADLGLPGLMTAAVPFGVNFEALPARCPEKPSLTKVKLLFVGLDWVRKGGDIAVAALDRLNMLGVEAELTIVGRCPDRHLRHPQIRAVGFLNKNKPAQARRLSQLYKEAHFLLLPSRADCTPMVIGEAMAHGTPVLATDTGGVATQLGGASTGRLLPPVAAPDRWAHEIADIARQPEIYRFMSDACFDRAQSALSWESWAHDIACIARNVARLERDLKVAVPA